MQAECGGNDEECEEEQKPDGPEDSRNRRTGIRGSAVRYGTYGMVWYGTLMTVLAQNAGNRLKVTIGPTIPRRPFSVHIQALHEVTWTRIPCRQGCGKDCHSGRTLDMGNRLGCSPPTAIPASPRGTSTSGTYLVYTTAKCIGIPRPATPRAGCRCSAPSTLIGPKPRPWPDPAISPFLPYRTVIGRRFPEHWHYYFFFFFLPPILILHMLVEIPGLNPYDLALCLCCVSVNCVLC